MELTVLGHYGPYPAPGGACSGYFVRAGKTRIVLDLGAGTFSRLVGLVPGLDMDGIILSHLHGDHMSDMLVLRYALAQFSQRGVRVTLPMPVVAPDEPREEYRMLTSSGVYALTASTDGMQGWIGEARFTLNRGTHSVTSYIVTLEHEGKKLVYTGDTGMRHDLEDICRNADLLLADTNFTEAECPSPPAPHMSGAEAGRLAAAAGVKRLVCTHMRGAGTDEAQILAQAKRYFPQAELASDMAVYTV